jgi:hypothetical protein
MKHDTLLYFKYGTHHGIGQTSQVGSYLTGQNKVRTQYIALPMYQVVQKHSTKDVINFFVTY